MGNLVKLWEHCLRRNGMERAWFLTKEMAEQFAADAANPAYRGDVPHLCVCGYWHLARPRWFQDPEYRKTIVGEESEGN